MARCRVVVLCLLVLVLVPGAALAGGQNLNWDDCVLASSNVKQFACNTNVGFDVLVGSFEPFVTVSDMTGIEAAIDLIFRDGYVPPWWQTQSGGCRIGGPIVNGVFTAQQTACTDPWQSQASGGSVTVVPGFQGNAARLRITVSMAVPNGVTLVVNPGTVYYGYQLLIRHGSTVGGACAGCEIPAIIVPAYTRLVSASNNDQYLYPTLDGTGWMCWQCRCGYDDAGLYFDPACAVTAIPNHTWGSIKTLYR